MKSEQRYLNLYFQVHQPRRLNRFQFFDVGSGRKYFDDDLNADIMQRIARECYLPANRLLLDLMKQHPEFRVTFSISGTALEQFEQYAPEVIESFKRLAETGGVEFLSETYYHSLSYFISNEEFIRQIELHRQKLNQLIGINPSFFRNTELIYSDAIGSIVAELGFAGMYIDGIDRVLNGRTSNALYRHPEKEFILMPRNYRLSDDIAFRYSDSQWSEYPLTGRKFTDWISRIPSDEKIVTLALDYETFGEHKKSESGIFDFLRDFIQCTHDRGDFRFVNPSEAIVLMSANDVVSTTSAISWADERRDVSAWLGNNMQRDAFDSLYKFQDAVMSTSDTTLSDAYSHLQTSDHFYYMATKDGSDGAVHQYFSPFASPYEAFMNFMNIIADLELRFKMLSDLKRRSVRIKDLPTALPDEITNPIAFISDDSGKEPVCR